MGRGTLAIVMATMMVAVCFSAKAQTPAAQESGPVITTDSGQLSGSEKDGVRRFFGIPFAAAPIGDLRWRAPQPVKPWNGVRQATEFGPVCMQNVDWIKNPQSEDCLSLNIWAPAKPGKYAVMLWIHGGGFRGGTGVQMGTNAGNSLVREGVILVTINYRLGVFGFFAHPELCRQATNGACGNQAILDQIAALKWVQKNIEGFGGDPSRVTIFGESAGGSSVALLMISPLAKGLFHRAIAESGVTDQMPDTDTAEKTGMSFAKSQGAKTLAELCAMKADKLVKLDWQPTVNVDKATLPTQPRATLESGQHNHVPVMLGWNADEGQDLAPEIFGTKEFSAASHEALLHKVFGPQIPAPILQLYPGNSDAEAKASIQRLVTDMIGMAHYRWAQWQKKTNMQPVYLYFFVHSPVEPPKEHPCGYGCQAGHGAEIRFAFDQLFLEERAWTKEDRDVASQMVRYWTNFAKTGDPNGENLSAWNGFDGAPDSVKRLGSDAEIKARGNFPDYRPYIAALP
jgi:para-nitrobenzyl esterase